MAKMVANNMWREAQELYNDKRYKESIANAISNFLKKDYEEKRETICEDCGTSYLLKDKEVYFDDSGRVECCPACYQERLKQESDLQMKIEEISSMPLASAASSLSSMSTTASLYGSIVYAAADDENRDKVLELEKELEQVKKKLLENKPKFNNGKKIKRRIEL